MKEKGKKVCWIFLPTYNEEEEVSEGKDQFPICCPFLYMDFLQHLQKILVEINVSVFMEDTSFRARL